MSLPSTQQLAATLDTEIRDLQPAGAALGTTLGGKISGNIAVAGLLDGPRVHARIVGSKLPVAATCEPAPIIDSRSRRNTPLESR